MNKNRLLLGMGAFAHASSSSPPFYRKENSLPPIEKAGSYPQKAILLFGTSTLY